VSRLLAAAAVMAAIPFGWLLGVAAARVLLGPDMGVFPVATIPLGWIAAIGFALARRFSPGLRLAVLAAGTGLLLIFL
jgi:hypothetical protein